MMSRPQKKSVPANVSFEGENEIDPVGSQSEGAVLLRRVFVCSSLLLLMMVELVGLLQLWPAAWFPLMFQEFFFAC